MGRNDEDDENDENEEKRLTSTDGVRHMSLLTIKDWMVLIVSIVLTASHSLLLGEGQGVPRTSNTP